MSTDTIFGNRTTLGNRTTVYNDLKPKIQQHPTTQTGQQQPQKEGLRASNDSLTLRDHVERAMHNYLSNLDGQEVSGIYSMVLSEVEAPLLETLMQYTRGNQTRVAAWLGINRGTCRKKLKQYGLI